MIYPKRITQEMPFRFLRTAPLFGPDQGTTTLGWHYLTDDGHIRNHWSSPPDGQWLYYRREDISICVAGLHAAYFLSDVFRYIYGDFLCRVECAEVFDSFEDKFVARWRKILWRVKLTEDFYRSLILHIILRRAKDISDVANNIKNSRFQQISDLLVEFATNKLARKKGPRRERYRTAFRDASIGFLFGLPYDRPRKPYDRNDDHDSNHPFRLEIGTNSPHLFNNIINKADLNDIIMHLLEEHFPHTIKTKPPTHQTIAIIG